MKTTKFLILEGDSDFAMDCLSSRSLIDNKKDIHYNECARMLVIECIHPNFDDNIVDLIDDGGDTIGFVRNAEGKLYYYEEVLTKEQLINRFE